MFPSPKESLHVIISKLKMFENQYSRKKIIEIAQNDDAINFKSYNICLAEADEQDSL